MAKFINGELLQHIEHLDDMHAARGGGGAWIPPDNHGILHEQAHVLRLYNV